MRALLLTLLTALLCTHTPAAEEGPTTHQEAAQQLIELLVDTEACLAGCTDAESVQAALPRLHKLADRAAALKQAQNKLPEPTTQDYLAGQELLGPFNTAWKAVRTHIERLEKAGLMGPELRALLGIAPEAAPAG